MSAWWERIKQSIRDLMIGRNGSDQLALASLIAAIVLALLSSLLRSPLLHLLSLAGYIYTLFRMFSRNISKRQLENDKFLEFFGSAKTKSSQGWQRAKNSTTYKYVNCPACKMLLRLPRKGKDGQKLGSVNVTCTNCKHTFTTKV